MRLSIAAGLALTAVLIFLGELNSAYLAFTATFAIFCLSARISLNWQIAIGTGLGVALGLIVFNRELLEVGTVMKPVGRVFIFMLKMLIAPMILLSISHGIASMGSARELGRIGARTLGLYLLTMALAVITGLVLVNLVQPGADSGLLESEFFRGSVLERAEQSAAGPDLGEFLLTTVYQVLTNPFDSLANGRILPIVFVAILLGIALAQMGERGRAAVDTIDGFYGAVMHIIGWFIRLAPVGVFALVGHLISTVPLAQIVEHLAAFSLVVFGGTLFHAAVTLPLVAWWFTGVSPLELLRAIREALAVAFTTSSSAATLPVTTRCVEENLGVPRRVSSFVLPLGATVNMDGTALYEAIAAVFVATIYGIELSIGAQLVVFLVAMATAIGAPGIPSAGMVTVIVVLESVGLPGEAVGFLLTIDRFLDTVRTMANVEGDAIVALCVARDEPAAAT